MNTPHSFHIPVMGLGYTIDTPIKAGRFGISSVVSIIEDQLLEEMRKFHCKNEGEVYEPIAEFEVDTRARRITAYLNLLHKILNKQMEKLKAETFEPGSDIEKYFEMLPDHSHLKQQYLEMKKADEPEKTELQNQLRKKIKPGAIDVNIMTKLDKTNFSKEGEALPVEFCDAMAALRGFAHSDLDAAIIFSAGLNPRLYSYCESFKDFFQDGRGHLKKRIILKVSDYRSALIQGKFLAKKGLWISEFRIESGLNCGGHAFATEGLLIGPILQEFKEKRNELAAELLTICNAALIEKNLKPFEHAPKLRITFQGGVGTAAEHEFLMNNYHLDAIGWGSPFLLVPEATNVDAPTLEQLSNAVKEDYYLSHASPLGVPFNNFRKASSNTQRQMRVEKGRPGSPCYKKFLVFNTEFTPTPICTASRQYQDLKIKQLHEQNLTPEVLAAELALIEEKDCLCEGLGAGALLKNNITPAHKLTAISICPGPNLAYFSGVFSLQEMVGHIYGRHTILNTLKRPHVFINEMVLYVDYLKKEIESQREAITAKQTKYFTSFKENLLSGVNYYKNIGPEIKQFSKTQLDSFVNDLEKLEKEISEIVFSKPDLVAL
jgi:hypothetical protein